MRRFNILQVLVCIILALIFNGSQVTAQRHQRSGPKSAVTGWADDTHILFISYESATNPVVKKIDIKTAKSEVVSTEPSGKELLIQSLPSGTALTMNDVISPDQMSIVLFRDNDLFIYKKEDGELKRLTNDIIAEVNTRFSPDGTMIAYTKNKDLYCYDLAKNMEKRLTFDASQKIYNGYASWVYYEEILGRPSKYAAFWWSPDGKKLAYLRTDESDVPVFTLNRLDEADGTHGIIEATPYPQPGDPNPKVKIGIADIRTSETVWIKTDYTVDQYIAWPFWTPDSKKLAVQVLNRDQNDISIILADPSSGDFTRIYNEKRKTWVQFFEDIYVLKNGSGYIIRSFRNDWENLYYYSWDGKLINQLTDFNFRVTGIERVDEESKIVYFAATGQESTDKHFFRVDLDGSNLLQLTHGSGTHDVSISPKGNYFTDTWSSIDSPGSIVVLDKKARIIREIHKFETPVFDPAKSSRSEMVKILTSDGLFSMPAIITYPVNFNPSKKYPVVFTIYGGPDDKNVSNTWQGNDLSWYEQNDIIVFKVDHRGSGHFGMKGLEYMYRSLGKWEMLDYSDAVKWLRTKTYVDSTRIGITGTSYGGYITCLALTKGADFWTHGFAGMSVTDYRLYDNIYTERYMDTPYDNPGGYRDGSALTFAKNYKGKLYLYHGEMDDNVHLQNSIYLISKLQDEGKSFEFMLYPGARHGLRGLKALHVKNEENSFWLRNFFGKTED